MQVMPYCTYPVKTQKPIPAFLAAIKKVEYPLLLPSCALCYNSIIRPKSQLR